MKRAHDKLNGGAAPAGNTGMLRNSRFEFFNMKRDARMVRLVKRSPEFVEGYKEFCREFYDNNITCFRPTDPEYIDDTWFERTKDRYDKKEQGLNGESRSYHYWAVDGDKFIGEFQLKLDLTEKVLTDTGSIGIAVRVPEWGKGYGTGILRQGLAVAKGFGMDKVIYNVNEENTRSRKLAEKCAGYILIR